MICTGRESRHLSSINRYQREHQMWGKSIQHNIFYPQVAEKHLYVISDLRCPCCSFLQSTGLRWKGTKLEQTKGPTEERAQGRPASSSPGWISKQRQHTTWERGSLWAQNNEVSGIDSVFVCCSCDKVGYWTCCWSDTNSAKCHPDTISWPKSSTLSIKCQKIGHTGHNSSSTREDLKHPFAL